MAHQGLVDGVGGLAALGDRPDDQGLAPRHVSGDEDFFDVRPAVAVGLDVPPVVEGDAQVIQQRPSVGAGVADRQEDQVGGVDILGPGDLDEAGPLAGLAGVLLSADRLQGGDVAVAADEVAGVDRILADPTFLVRGAAAEDV